MEQKWNKSGRKLITIAILMMQQILHVSCQFIADHHKTVKTLIIIHLEYRMLNIITGFVEFL